MDVICQANRLGFFFENSSAIWQFWKPQRTQQIVSGLLTVVFCQKKMIQCRVCILNNYILPIATTLKKKKKKKIHLINISWENWNYFYLPLKIMLRYCHNILIVSQSIFKYVCKNNNKQINKQIKLKIVLICQKY